MNAFPYANSLLLIMFRRRLEDKYSDTKKLSKGLGEFGESAWKHVRAYAKIDQYKHQGKLHHERVPEYKAKIKELKKNKAKDEEVQAAEAKKSEVEMIADEWKIVAKQQ